ncbi:MAG: dihydrofolate reductase, partial [Bacteroidaceae bacterium]
MKGKLFVKIMMIVGMQAVFAGCVEKKADFKYLLDEFADIKVMRYTIPGWEELSLQQKEYAYHLSEAAKWGRDIFWDQNCRYNLAIRHTVENILENYKGERDTKEFDDFTIYAKRLF